MKELGGTGSQNVKVNGKELIFSMPGSLLEDHPGNIVAVDNEILNIKGTFRCFGRFPKSVKDGVFGPGRFLVNEKVNKAFGGYAAIITYEYNENYDPGPST